MATSGSANGNTTGSGYWRIRMDWSVNNSPGDYATVSVDVYRYAVKKDTSGYDARKDTTTITIDGVSGSGTPTWNHANSQGQVRWLWGWSRNVSKTHAQREVGVSASDYHPSGTMKGTSSTSGTATIYAKASYAVSYNANGGEGTISNNTKWYGEALTLSDGTGFTWNNHTLVGWNTAADGSGTHYDLSESYTGNAALTLYAEWVLSAITVYTKINGEICKGIFDIKLDDEIIVPHLGYVKVDDEWQLITG